MAYLIGIDVGTSSTKALLIDESGKVLKSVAPEYEFQTPKPLWAESDPADWWSATIEAIKSLLEDIDPGQVVGLGLTGQMHGLVCLDKSGDVLRPCIMWNDQRTADQCREMTARIGEDDVIAITGNPILPGFTAPKLRWVQENEPEVYERIDKILLPKDYIRYKLSGEFFTDVSDASGMSLLDVRQRHWARYILNEFQWPESWLPEVTESPVASTKLSNEAASLTGLPAGLPIIAVVVIKLRRLLGVALCVKVLSPLLLAPLASSLLILMNTESNQKVGCMRSAMRFRASGISWV